MFSIVSVKFGESVYIMFKRNKHNQPKSKSYFDHIQSRRITKKLDLFKKDPNDLKNSHVSLRFYTIDFVNKKVYQTTDPANEEEQFEFAEGTAQERERSDPSRFIVNIAAESLKHGNNGEFNKLGRDWFDKYGRPTLKLTQILLGLKEEERKQLTVTSGLHP
jgi:hypothetical protein